MEKKWSQNGNEWHFNNASKQVEFLDNGVYILKHDEYHRFYWLEKFADNFKFDYKVYGLESKLINRVLTTYKNKGGNLGILFNGLKGTGKSVTAEILCNKFEQPTIIITGGISQKGVLFLSSITQNASIFIDEYEKIFGGDSNTLLTIMDGALNSAFKRVFIFTTNTLNVSEFLLERPSRIRYLKTFANLSAEVVEEILDDRLNNKEFKEQVFEFIMSLRTITIDTVLSVVDEVNIHKELPCEFETIFNVKRVQQNNNGLINANTGDFTIKESSSKIKSGSRFRSPGISSGYSIAGKLNIGEGPVAPNASDEPMYLGGEMEENN